jgi:uncharacterized protein involved in type VI secretion and phage assembly
MSDSELFLTIHTALKHPPLGLVMVKGAEGMSMPYSYEVTMVRYKGGGDFEPRELIGTACAIGIRQKRQNESSMPDPRTPEYIVRRGVFEHLERVAGTAKNRDYFVYYGRVVPAFKLLARESRYRIFENQDVLSILDSSLSGYPNLRFDLELLRREDPPLPTLDYCVQFGETTFAFVSRLMARYGMWYYFDHGTDPDGAFDQEQQRTNETLVVGRRGTGPIFSLGLEIGIRNAAHGEVAMTDAEKLKDVGYVHNVIRRYHPPSHIVSVGNFNPLQPTAPFGAGVNVSAQYFDPVVGGGAARRFDETAFPEPILSEEEAEDYARQLMRGRESAAYTVTGDGSEMSFRAGRTFIVTESTIDDEDVTTRFIFDTEKPKYLITALTFVATDGAYASTVGNTIEDFFSVFTKDFESGPDVVAHVAHGMIESYLEKTNEVAWEKLLYPKSSDAQWAHFFPAVLAGATWSATGPIVLANIYKAVKALVNGMESNYRNSFVAVPWRPHARNFDRPVPVAAPRPVAHGPHLAVVIGRSGAEPGEGESDIWADALGRVRVRFPWDAGSPQSRASSRWKTDENTCWLRVSEGWAGTGFGTQFLPRIGQQVLVEFIDGDPEQPIIVGRIYSAKSGFTGLPFPSPEARSKGLTMDEWRDPKTISGHFERSGIKTRSTPVAPTARAGFHLLRLDDTNGKEQFLMRSQGRLDVTALGSHFETTHGARHSIVGGRDPKTGEGAGDCLTHVFGECDLRVEQGRYEEVGKDYQLHVKGDTIVSVEGSISSNVGSTASLSAGSIVLDASTGITLRVGQSSVMLTPAGIYISGPLVHLNSPGAPPPDNATPVVLVDLLDASRADAGES